MFSFVALAPYTTNTNTSYDFYEPSRTTHVYSQLVQFKTCVYTSTGFLIMQLSVRGRFRNPRVLKRVSDSQVRHLHRSRAVHRVDARIPARDRCGWQQAVANQRYLFHQFHSDLGACRHGNGRIGIEIVPLWIFNDNTSAQLSELLWNHFLK